LSAYWRNQQPFFSSISVNTNKQLKMKKNILLLVLAVMLFEPSFGQVSRESYEKAVDILNYQSVYYSLSVLSPTSGVTAKFKTSCNCENNPAFEKIKSSIPETEPQTIKISNEIQV